MLYFSNTLELMEGTFGLALKALYNAKFTLLKLPRKEKSSSFISFACSVLARRYTKGPESWKSAPCDVT